MLSTMHDGYNATESSTVVPGGSGDPADDAFPATLRTALRRSGLPLDRVSERLRTQGLFVSPATLSSWQRGHRRPEHARSLRALDALDELLGLSDGTLRSLLGPRKPRGRVADSPRRNPGPHGHVETVMGDGLAAVLRDADQRTQALIANEVVRVGADGAVTAVASTTVLRAHRHGATRATFAHIIDHEANEPPHISVTSGYVERSVYMKDLNLLVIDVHFGHVLAKLATEVTSYTIEVTPSGNPSTHYGRWEGSPVREYLLETRFHSSAPPRSCRHVYSEQIGASPLTDKCLAMNAPDRAHFLVTRCAPGVHGMAWGLA